MNTYESFIISVFMNNLYAFQRISFYFQHLMDTHTHTLCISMEPYKYHIFQLRFLLFIECRQDQIDGSQLHLSISGFDWISIYFFI